MDSNPITSAYYSEDDSNTSSSQEDPKQSSRKPNNGSQNEEPRRASADHTTMSKDLTDEIVLRIMKKIQAGLDEAIIPNEKDAPTDPTTEEEKHSDNQERQRGPQHNVKGSHRRNRIENHEKDTSRIR